MKILVVDNYDSFVYNIVHLLDAFNKAEIVVVKNDDFSIDAVKTFDKIVLSPGPGLPKDAGFMPELLKRYASCKSILGVCLGHQAIVEHFGGGLSNLEVPLHGVASTAKVVEKDYLFTNIPDCFEVGHYHSWVAKAPLPEELVITLQDQNNNIMAVKHQTLDVRGVQFHPESILTPVGKQILRNWIFN